MDFWKRHELDCSNDCGFEYGVSDSTDFLPKFRRTKLAKTGIFHETDAGRFSWHSAVSLLLYFVLLQEV